VNESKAGFAEMVWGSFADLIFLICLICLICCSLRQSVGMTLLCQQQQMFQSAKLPQAISAEAANS